ncbi:MAG: hypothetical protein NC092_05845 [Butyrivibrio sp.]|nr:hypothetical protein [Butyrivibrio sp.]
MIAAVIKNVIPHIQDSGMANLTYQVNSLKINL